MLSNYEALLISVEIMCYRDHLIATMPSDATWRHGSLSTLVLVIIPRRVIYAKALPEQVLTHCQLDPNEQNLVYFESKYQQFHKKYVWKCPQYVNKCPHHSSQICFIGSHSTPGLAYRPPKNRYDVVTSTTSTGIDVKY